MRIYADMTLAGVQARYKKFFDRTVQLMPAITPGQQVFADRATKATQSLAELMAEARRTKLLVRSTGPFPVQSATTDTVPIQEEGVQNKVSISRVTVAPLPPQPPTKAPSDVIPALSHAVDRPDKALAT